MVIIRPRCIQIRASKREKKYAGRKSRTRGNLDRVVRARFGDKRNVPSNLNRIRHASNSRSSPSVNNEQRIPLRESKTYTCTFLHFRYSVVIVGPFRTTNPKVGNRRIVVSKVNVRRTVFRYIFSVFSRTNGVNEKQFSK